MQSKAVITAEQLSYDRAIWSAFKQFYPGFITKDNWNMGAVQPLLTLTALANQQKFLVAIRPVFEWDDMMRFASQVTYPAGANEQGGTVWGLVIADSIPDDVLSYDSEAAMYCFVRRPKNTFYRRALPNAMFTPIRVPE